MGVSQESRVVAFIVCYSIPIALEIVSTGARLWAKWIQGGRNRFTLDDFFIIIATMCAIGESCVGLSLGPPNGFGRHIETVSSEQIKRLELGNYIFSHFYNIALGSVKLSILFFYHRVFVTPIFQRVVKVTIAVIMLWLLAITIILALQCRPIAKFWDPSISGTCFNLVSFSYFTNITNLVTDLWIFFLPIPVIWGLQISKAQKIGLCGVFLIGLGTCVISSVRISVVVAQGSNDFTWEGVPLGIMSVFEPLGGILSANLPVTYALVRKITRSSSQQSPKSGQARSSGHASDSYGSSKRGSKMGRLAEDAWIQTDIEVTWSEKEKSAPIVTTNEVNEDDIV